MRIEFQRALIGCEGFRRLLPFHEQIAQQFFGGQGGPGVTGAFGVASSSAAGFTHERHSRIFFSFHMLDPRLEFQS
jgi:hypothetical protein